ncbi:hypothetical protein [Streptococcus ruminantium]|uniref:hypothetical protein n=1 Tax=Streptococcus ruminantium TaxID=1917441 RepID=UPI001F3DA40D|nr:hypothetical protein [Streptococcus ruminantium]BDD43312.1 hypothetical protein GUT189_16450 [Streptococcus ruminantium]
MNNELELYKIVVYNFLYKFSEIETRLKKKFEEQLQEVGDSEIKNNFILLHLAEEIKIKFDADIPNSGFQIKKLHYKNNLENMNVKWNLKKRISFAKKYNLMTEVLSNVEHLQKRAILPVDKIIEDAIKIRNCLAHETFGIKLDTKFELLSDDKLKDMVDNDCEFSSSSGVVELESNYKYALTYYFYLKEIEKLIN